MRTPLRPARDAFVVRHILDSHGGVMIAAVAAILLIGVLGAGVVSMVGTSSQEEVRANHGERAFLLAESGFRFAESAYKVVLDDPVQGREAAKAALLALDDFTQAAPGGGAFTLHVSLPEDPYDTEAIVAGNQSVQKGGNLTLQAGANLVPRNGVFRHEGAYYRYREFVNDTLVDIIGVEEGQAFPLNFSENQVLTDYFYSEVVEVVSTGEYPGSGNLNVSRDLTYWWPLPGGGAAGGPGENEFSGEPDVWEDFSNDSANFLEGTNLGSYDIVDGALSVTGVQQTQGTFLTIYQTDSNMVSDYELQGKVRVADGVIHMAGLTFRKQNAGLNPAQRKSYGLSFLRGGGNTHPVHGDSIPDFDINNPNKLHIVLWEAPQNAPPAGQSDLIAYKEITNDNIITNGKLTDWSTLLVRIRQIENQNYITVFYADARNSVSGDAFADNKTRKSNPRDGLGSGDAKYLPWPPNNLTTWDATNDYFTLVTWDWVNPNKGELISDGPYENSVVRTDEGDMNFVVPVYELGLHAFGKNETVTKVSFDDFSFRIAKPGNNGPDTYIPPILIQ